YRKRFRVDASATNKLVTIEFDGIYNHSEVWINGHFVGGRPYGYSSFECDLTPHLKFGSGENVVAVRVDHSRFADSRWYTGSGIYRHVRLRITNTVHFTQWGTFVTPSIFRVSPETNAVLAFIRFGAAVESGESTTTNLFVESEVIAPDGDQILTGL